MAMRACYSEQNEKFKVFQLYKWVIFAEQTNKKRMSYKMEQSEKPLSYHEVVSTNNCIFVQFHKVATIEK